jgi:hypothetical protein
MRNVELDELRGRGGRLVCPEGIDDPFDRTTRLSLKRR